MKLDKKYIGQIYACLKELCCTEAKEELVYAYTSERTTSIKDMSETEAKSLLKYLRSEIKKLNPTKEELGKENATRRYIISLWYRIEMAETANERKIALKICFDWVEKHFKGPLNSFSSQELYKIKLAAEKVLQDRSKAVRRAVANAST